MSTEISNKILEVSADFIKNLDSTIPGVVHEITNYFIFISVMAIIKNLFFLLIVGLFYRILSTQIALADAEKKNYKDEKVREALTSSIRALGLLRGLGSLAAVIGILLTSYPHIESIGKALFAPRIFIIEKAKEWKK